MTHNWNRDPAYLAMRDSTRHSRPLIPLRVHALIWSAGIAFGLIMYFVTS